MTASATYNVPPAQVRTADATGVFILALLVRLAFIAWARTRFPAVEDGHYYDVLAHRLASGHGYTWLWPDGAVTYAAHYPVGYPAFLALCYAAFGASTATAMAANALIGAAGAFAAHRLVDGEGVARWRPMAAGIAVALHPALLPYTAALMTEGLTACLWAIAAALSARARNSDRPWRWLAAAGITVGMATLVRPQSLILGPVLGLLAARPHAGLKPRLLAAAVVTSAALACVAPWTARNCMHMHRCALVSVNGGWNLLIGAQTRSGAWEPMIVPPECEAVWDEAAKDGCFERAARKAIWAEPGRWLARIPGKMAVTFDYFGAAPWYLHASNPIVFGPRAQVALGSLETIVCRVVLLFALVGCGRWEGERPLARKVSAVAGAVGALTVHGWLGYAALMGTVGLLGGRALARAPLVIPAAAAVVGATAAVHAAFFGAGRYGLVVVPLVTAVAFVGVPPGRAPKGVGSGRLRWRRSKGTLPRVDAARAIAGGSRSSPRGAGVTRREESPSSTEHDAG